FKISVKSRIESTFDSFNEMFNNVKNLGTEFPGYKEKLNTSQKLTDLEDAVVTGVASINNIDVCVAVMDSEFMMGSMGSVVGEKITLLIEYATDNNLPLIIFCASGGARMQEGIISLMQMAKISAALSRFKEKNLYVSVLTNPTTGGVSASFASLGDITIAEPKALIGFAGKRVIESTIKETLPDEFQTAEFLLEKGFLDLIVERKKLKETLYKILSLHNYDN
ncbi:MAG: acetyl-CoA carboxylase carboxyltransferase subunit beta, partial [Anaeroplasmataceae bacterium]